MTATVERELTDDEWREETFPEELLISARLSKKHGKDPSFGQLKNYIEKYGPDGVLETAVLLPRRQYEELERLCRGADKPQRSRRRK